LLAELLGEQVDSKKPVDSLHPSLLFNGKCGEAAADAVKEGNTRYFVAHLGKGSVAEKN
jgi:hypothetical protein